MIWRDEWASVAARIDGLLNAAQFFVHTLSINSEDEYGIADKHIAEQACEIVDNLSSFLASHRAAMPPVAAISLQQFLALYSKLLGGECLTHVDTEGRSVGYVPG